jgi:hypothetical protein
MKKILALVLLCFPLLVEGPGEPFYDIESQQTYVYVIRPDGSSGCVIVTKLENTGLSYGSWGDQLPGTY